MQLRVRLAVRMAALWRCGAALILVLSLLGGLTAASAARVQSTTWHVATTGSDTAGNGSPSNPFATIQHAIDASAGGDTVLVQPGVYRENINFNGKNITVGSLFITTGDEDFILQTVIDGNRNGRVVTFVNGEAATATLSGFTITNGYAHGAAEPETYGGGIYTRFSDPTLTHLRVTGNEAVEGGGGLHFRDSSPTVRNIVVTNNRAENGGGIRYTGSSVNLENAVVTHNSATLGGSGLFFYHADGAVKNALIADNSGGGKGGGLGFDGCSPTFTNVTIVGNRTTGYGGGLNVSYMSEPTLVNSIVWGNTPEQIYFDTDWPGEAVTIEYSDIQGGQAGIVTNGQGPVHWGQGNMEISPRFVHAGLGNYRPANTSPTIGAGKPEGAPSTDVEGNPRPNPAGSKPDMGAYENARSSPDLPPAVTFTRLTSGDIVTDGGHSSGACWGDYDNDGHIDLFVTNWEGENNYLYHNNGDGSFEKITSGRIVNDGGWSRSCTWGDYDNDGFLDLAVSDDGAGVFLYHNEAGAAFTRILDTPIAHDYGNCYGISWVDYDNDGWLDLFVARHTDADNLLYHNQGDGTFEKITTGAIVNDGGKSNAISWGDYDADGCVDLFVNNVDNQPNFLYHNNCDGSFSRVTAGPIATDQSSFSTTSNWVDYDNDSDLDLFVGNPYEDNYLYRNDGGGAFAKITTGVIVTDGSTHNSSWGDYDNDGDLDLVAGPDDRLQDHQRLYQNSGNGVFTRVTTGAIVEDIGASGALWADYDSDGDLDLFIANEEIGQRNMLYRNDGTGSHWLHIKLVGAAPDRMLAGVGTNRSAIGARVTVAATVNGLPVQQVQEVSGQTGNFSQNSLFLEFGLGDATVVSSVTIRWPSGVVQTLRDIAGDQLLTVREAAPTYRVYLPFVNTTPRSAEGLYFVRGDVLYQMNLDGSDLRSIANGLQDNSELAVDPLHRKIYAGRWPQSPQIHIFDLDTRELKVFSDGPGDGGQGLALDPAGYKMYHGLYYGGVYVMDMNTLGAWTQLVDPTSLDPMYGQRGQLQVDPVNRHIYFRSTFNGECGLCRYIWRVGFDGDGLIKVIQANGGDALALDLTERKMYFTDAPGDYTIKRANLDGSSVEVLLALPEPFNTCSSMALDVERQKMYLNLSTDADDGYRGKAIARANLDGSGFEILHTVHGNAESEVHGYLALFLPSAPAP